MPLSEDQLMDREEFVRKFSQDLSNQRAALFAGAGLSIAAGHVSWNSLLIPAMNHLKLSGNDTTDMVAVAQYYINNGNNYRDLLDIILEKLNISSIPTANHAVLAGLPFTTYWTTNFDNLIETSLSQIGKKFKKIYKNDQVSSLRSKSETIVHKMHGDIGDEKSIIITAKHFEEYKFTHPNMLDALLTDMNRNTFLFLGFSFMDPNLQNVLSRMRTSLDQDMRRHYAIFKQPTTRLEILRLQDLKLRYNIQPIFIEKYSDLNQLLQSIENCYKSQHIFIAGSPNGDLMNHNEKDVFLRELSRLLVDRGHKITISSGNLLNREITHHILEIALERNSVASNHLNLQSYPPDPKRHEEHRLRMVKANGILLCISGSKKDDSMSGIYKEVQIAMSLKIPVLPLGFTGGKSLEIWENMRSNIHYYFPKATNEFIDAFNSLGPFSRHSTLIPSLSAVNKAIEETIKMIST